MKKKTKIAFLIYILIGIICGILIKLFLFDVLKVHGTSMEPLIKNNDSVFVCKFIYRIRKPEAGEIVIYRYKGNLVVKRCVATEFTPLEFSTDSGYTLNVAGRKIPLTEYQFHKLNGNKEVPAKTVLLIGDNVNNSVDSRDYGFVPANEILGKVLSR